MAKDNVNAPQHYLHGKKETIDVISDCMTSDEFHGYLKGNILKYVSRYKFKGCLLYTSPSPRDRG